MCDVMKQYPFKDVLDQYPCPICKNGHITFSNFYQKWMCNYCDFMKEYVYVEGLNLPKHIELLSMYKRIEDKPTIVHNKSSLDNRPSWHDLYFTMCYLVAMRSKDDHTHIGAVIVDEDNVLVSTGYNSFSRNVEVDNDGKRLSRNGGEKYHWFEHAERNAIYNAARRGTQLKGCKLYVTLTPCSDCTRAIIQTGINTVYIHQEGEDFYKKHATDSWNIDRSITMFKESGVNIEYINSKVVNIDVYMNKTFNNLNQVKDTNIDASVIFQKLANYSQKHPELRFGQILSNTFDNFYQDNFRHNAMKNSTDDKVDIYYLPNDYFIRKMKNKLDD